MQQEFNKCLQSDLIIEDSPEEIIQDIDMPNADTNKIIQLLNDDLQQKQLFMQSDDFKNFTQILVVSQIIMNFSNDDPFFRHITNVYRSIRKAVKRIFLDQSIIKHKSELQQLLKIYYQDITIGFITSTGQIKSTAFIFIIRPLESALNTQRINLQKRNSLKMTMHFSSTTIRPTVGRLLSKQSFMRKNKFENEFIILQEEAQLQDKLYHVYRPIDDQIYFVKRVLFINHQIQLQNITFQDVFHNYNDKIQEAKLIGRITHPNIQRLYDWWLEQNYLFMQLEYCTYPGQRSHAKNLLSYSYFYMNPKPYEEKIQAIKDIILQIINGLEYLQKKDIHHGDLKPENIMVTITITGETQVFILYQNHFPTKIRFSYLTLINQAEYKRGLINLHQEQSKMKGPKHLLRLQYQYYIQFLHFQVILLCVIIIYRHFSCLMQMIYFNYMTRGQVNMLGIGTKIFHSSYTRILCIYQKGYLIKDSQSYQKLECICIIFDFFYFYILYYMKFDKHQKTKQVRIVDQIDQFDFENSQKKLENKDIYIEEMRLKVKLKDMNYDQIAQQYLKSQKLNDELKSKLQMAEEENTNLKDKFHQKQIQIASVEKKYDDYKKLFMSVQQELAQEKIKSTKLIQEIGQLKEELKKKSSFQLNLQKCDDQSVDTISTCNRRSTMDKSNTDLVSFLQRELKSQQIQINEKNKTIELMGEQIKAQMNTIQSLSKIHQQDITKLKQQKFEGQIKSPDSGRQSVLYSCISDNKLQTIKEVDNSPIVNRTYQSQNSLKSTATIRDRKSIKDVYHKLNQSTLYQAALKSNCLDYSTLHIEPQFLNDTNSNDER